MKKETNKELILRFKRLKTTKEKLSFWINELGKNYIQYLEDRSYYADFEDFEIVADTKAKRNEINAYILENYYRIGIFHNQCDVEVLNLKEMKAALNDRCKVTKEKLKILIEEDRKIDNSFSSPNSSCYGIRVNLDFNADLNTYEARLKYNITPDLSEMEPRIDIVQIYNGNVLAEYKLYVTEQIKKSKMLKEPKNEGQLTLNQYTLLFQYCGIWEALKCDVSEKAKLFADLLPSESDKRIYDSIREAGAKKRKNKEDLEVILAYLEKRKIKSYQDSVKKDFEKLA